MRIVVMYYILCLTVPAISQAKDFENGSFADGPAVDSNGLAPVPKGSKSISHWFVLRRSVDYVTTYWQSPPGTTASIDLDGSQTPGNGDSNQSGGLSQSFTTSPGSSYAVSFYLSGNPTGRPDCRASKKRVEVTTGPQKTSFIFDVASEGNTRSDMKWIQETINFIATETTSVIRFVSRTPGFCGPAIGNVVLTSGN